MTLTRARALKLAGAALAGSAFSLFWVTDEADAKKKRRKRRKRRRRKPGKGRKRPTVTPNPVKFPGTGTQTVTINNPAGGRPVYLSPNLGNGFSFGPGVNLNVPILPGTKARVPIVLAVLPGLQKGNLRLIDAEDNVVVNAPLVEV